MRSGNSITVDKDQLLISFEVDMHPNNVTNPVNREKLKQVLKKYNMSFDAYLEEKIEEDYSLIFKKKR